MVQLVQQRRKRVKTNNQKKIVIYVWLVVQLGKMKHSVNGIQVNETFRFAQMNCFFFLDDFRLFCGDLGNEVNDDVLTRAFNKYSSFQKAKVVRDKRSGKSRGYGFVSFKDSKDFIQAMREMNGKNIFNVNLLSKFYLFVVFSR